MAPPSVLIRIFVVALLAAPVTSGCSPSSPEVVPEPTSTSQRLARTLDIIAQSTPEQPQVLRVLFYGQSITSPEWTDLAVVRLRQTYPNTRFDVLNMALGGFSSTLLERTVERDIADFYPDLIVFHVYGDHRAYERIVRSIRSRTAADLILQTDHVTSPVEPVCREGLHFTLSPPPGCKGFVWYKQNSWDEFVSSTLIPQLADRYDAAVDPRRVLWNAYLMQHKLEPQALLVDSVHPNEDGWRLMAQLFSDYFDRVVADYRGEQSNLVSRLPAPKVPGTTSYRFEGNRAELVARGTLDGRVEVSIDGQPAADVEGCWLTSRTTRLPNVPDWPAIRRVTVAPVVNRTERWTVRVTDLNPDQSDFKFALTSDIGGPDGEGRASEDFRSPSGRIRIESKDWVIHEAYSLSQKKVLEGFTIDWSRDFICHDQPAVATGVGDQVEVRHILANGLHNGPHEMTLQLAPEALPLIREVRTYRPPLRD